ncbi:MAG: GFA family protein [Pseudomonadota bacterium]
MTVSSTPRTDKYGLPRTLERTVTTRGYCLCKKTQWEFDGSITWACYCHCDDCRRNCAAPVVGWIGVPRKMFRWTGDAPKTFESSKGVFRHFCGRCGSPMGFEADHYPGGMHLYAASMENPEDFEPTFHVYYQSKLPWLAMDDALPKFDGTLLETPNDPGGYE